MSLKSEREKKKLSQADLAEAIGVSQSLIAQMESGEKHGSMKTNAKMARYFNVPVEAIYNVFPNTQSNKEAIK